MTEKKYESPPDYQKLKQQRLRQIQEDYYPPPKKTCPFFQPLSSLYIPAHLYQPDEYDTFTPSLIFEVKNDTKLHTFIIALLIFGCFFTVIPQADGSLDTGAYVMMGIGLIGIIYSLLKIVDKTVYLRICDRGVHFYMNDLFILWDQVTAVHFFIQDPTELDGIDELIVDYIDTATHTCQTIRFPIKYYDKTISHIAMALQHYYIDLPPKPITA